MGVTPSLSSSLVFIVHQLHASRCQVWGYGVDEADVVPAPVGSPSMGWGNESRERDRAGCDAVRGWGGDVSWGSLSEGEGGRWPWGPAPPARVAPSGLCPQVDELYEGYCIQCRLRDGASNMQRAFSRCPPSRASRESLQELGRSLQECTEVGAGAGGWGGPRGRWFSAHGPLTAGSVRSPAANPGPAASALCGALQDMWLIEGALEVHLGEFHVRMKGNELSRGRGQSGWGVRTSGAPGLLLRVKGWSDSQWSRPSPGFPFV